MNRRIPSLRRHKPSSRAVVTLNGVDHYLGPWPAGRKRPSVEVQAQYERVIAEWLSSGRQTVAPPGSGGALPATFPEHGPPSTGTTRTVAELLAAYWDHAERYYRRPDGGRLRNWTACGLPSFHFGGCTTTCPSPTFPR
jgi:hypothetical protein